MCGFIEECLECEIAADIDESQPYPQYQPMIPPIYGVDVGSDYYCTHTDSTSTAAVTFTPSVAPNIIVAR